MCLHGTDPATVYLSAWSRVDDFSVAELEDASTRTELWSSTSRCAAPSSCFRARYCRLRRPVQATGWQPPSVAA